MTISKEAIEAAHAEINKSWRNERWEWDAPKSAAERALRAALPFLPIAGEGKVKGLEWEDATDRGYSQANCALGQYQVTWLGEFECWQCYRPHKQGNKWSDNFSQHPNKSEAKEAAQADFNERISCAIDPETAIFEEHRVQVLQDEKRDLIKTLERIAGLVESRAAIIDTMTKALETIVKGETTVFDDDLQCDVHAWMDKEEMRDVARTALLESNP